MSYEVNRRFVEQNVLFIEYSILLAIGSDDRGPAHTFVKVRVDGPPERCSNFVKLPVSCHERLDETTHKPHNRNSSKKYLP